MSPRGVIRLTRQIYVLPDLSAPVFVLEGLSYLPPVLSAGYTTRRGAAKETISEILVSDLGDATSSSPFLIASPADGALRGCR